MSELTKTRDEDGIWTGGWKVLVKLHQHHNITQHLPNSFFIGREKGVCFYAGQPRKCFKCGKTGHLASACTMVKCNLCGEVGHVSANCQVIRCNLCGKIGHPHRDCPDAWHNICKDFPDEDLLAGADDLEEDALLSGSVPTGPEPQPEIPHSDPAQTQPQSDVIEGNMEVVTQAVYSEAASSSAPVSTTGENKQSKRKKKDKTSRKPEGEWTTVQKPSKVKVDSRPDGTLTANRFSVLSESDAEAEMERELNRMMAEYDEDPNDDPPKKKRPIQVEGQYESDMETGGGQQEDSDSDL